MVSDQKMVLEGIDKWWPSADRGDHSESTFMCFAGRQLQTMYFGLVECEQVLNRTHLAAQTE